MKRPALLPFLAVLAAGCSGTPGEMSDWERAQEKRPTPAERAVVLPPYPPRGELLEFSAGPTSTFRFFVEAGSISVNDGVVRYTLVARSDQGVQNISYEGLRCASADVRIYAVGRDGAWSARPGDWQGLAAWHRPLYRDYLCPYRQAIQHPNEAIAALRR